MPALPALASARPESPGREHGIAGRAEDSPVEVLTLPMMISGVVG